MASLAAAMRMGNNGDMSGGAQGSTGPQQQGVQATGPEQTLRMHQAEALLRSQAEAALRLAVSTDISNPLWILGEPMEPGTYISIKILQNLMTRVQEAPVLFSLKYSQEKIRRGEAYGEPT